MKPDDMVTKQQQNSRIEWDQIQVSHDANSKKDNALYYYAVVYQGNVPKSELQDCMQEAKRPASSWSLNRKTISNSKSS